MIDVLSTILVAIMIAAGTSLFARRVPAVVRPLVWLGFAECVAFYITQSIYSRVIVEGGDTLWYTTSGAALAKYLDQNFTFMAPEVGKLLLQIPSRIDRFPEVEGAGSNTGSMYAMATFLVYFLGSDYAAHAFVAGLAFFGAILIFLAIHDTAPDLPPRQVFLATVLFPSIGFWTAAFHKESFCLMGFGLLLTSWRSFYRRRWVLAILTAPVGIGLIALFRAPTIPPLFLGLAIYFVWERIKRSRGGDAVIFGPIYLVVGFFVVAAGMVLISRIDPNLGIDKIGDTMGRKQAMWARSKGGSELDIDESDIAPSTTAEQLANVPVALANALFRPQLFDVHNFGTLVSAIEMTVLSYLLLRAVVRRGIRGILSDLEGSPLFLMCAIITFVGCAFVGLVTYNLGTLARYRVPFLPFYGTCVVYMSQPLQQALAAPSKPPTSDVGVAEVRGA